MAINLSGSLVISGSLTTTGNISMSGSIASASFALSASETSKLQGLGSASFAPAATFNTVSQSFATTSGSIAGRVTLIEGQYATTGSNTFTGVQYISEASNAISFTSTASLYTDGGLRVAKDSFVSGTAYFNNITVYGTSSIEYITSSQVNIGSNIITVNTDTPAVRFGGLSVFDSGSTQLTGSLFWDSEKNHWIYSNPSGSSYNSAMLMNGPRNTGSLGDEQGTTSNALMKGQGGDHITSSQMFDDGTTVRIPGNFQVTGSTILSSALSGTSATFSGDLTIDTNTLFVDSTNNRVGIGTTSPATRFELAGSSGNFQIGSSGAEVFFTRNENNDFLANGGSSAGIRFGGQQQLRFATGTDLTTRLTIGSTGAATFSNNLAVGGSTDDTSGGLYTNIAINATSYSRYSLLTGGTARGRFQFDGTDVSMISTSTGGKLQIGTIGANSMEFVTNDSLKMTITSGGAVNIGTTTNAYGLLAIKSNNTLTYGGINVYANGNDRFIALQHTGTIGVIETENAGSGVMTDLAFRTGGSERMRITSGGNVLIGTNSDSGLAKLQVAGDTSSATSLNAPTAYKINNDNNWAYGCFNSGNQYWMQPQFSGTGDDTRGFRVLNTTGALVEFRVNGAGNAFLRGSLTQNASDRRLKTNVKNIHNALQKVLSINGVTFDWIDNIKELGFIPQIHKNDAGVLAQEIQSVLPQAIDFAPFDYQEGVSKSGENYLTVKYEKIVPLLIEAVKEQQSLITGLTQEVNTLKAQVETLGK